jgi:hypothetical protein
MKNLIVIIILITSFSIAQKTKETNRNQPIKDATTATETFLIDVNRLKLPIENSGVIADVFFNGVQGGRYDSKSVFFSAGLFLSGYSNGMMWTNANASASRLQDYLKGQVNTLPSDPRNLVYTVSISDPAFGYIWQEWKDAVDIGADFYDGNNDGIYNPVDLNSNGIWDTNEDKPDILGDITTYCVYNDGVDASLRRFNDVTPKGIEISQTIFAYSDSSQNTLNNTIFVRYKIVNRGTVSSVMDSVYFSFWADPDVGNYVDDLVGCDTLLDAGFVYHNAPDGEFGNAAPTVLTSILQGPYYYIPGETFIDNNSNGIYDDGIDTPIDTAYNRKGSLRGIEIRPGAKNQGMSSFIHYMASHATHGDPNTSFEAREYMKGNNKFGIPIDPCTWIYGTVNGVNCTEVNSSFMYSGNPATNVGWLNNLKTDQRTMVNTGPFRLIENEPMELIGAFLVGRKDDPFSSFYEARRIASYVRSFYKSNFGEFPLSVENKSSEILNNFELFQNYPNPFNPATVISYSLPKATNVKLVIMNILGEEVTTLVNEYQSEGKYSKSFNASNLTSGVYFYCLTTDMGVSNKKMIVIK